MDKYYEISNDVRHRFMEVFNTKTIPVSIKFKFLGYAKQKSMINLVKMPEKYQFLTGAEILVTVNEDLYDKFDDESIEILFTQQIDKISVNIDSGKVTLKKPDLTTFSGIVNKYGIEKVARANQVEELTVEQKEDQEEILN